MNCIVTPDGISLAASVTAEVNPFVGVIVIAVPAEAPAAAAIVDAAALSVNVAGDAIVTANVTVLDTLPLVPLIVIA